MSDRDFDDLVNTIYEALVDDSVLNRVPDALASYCGARSASLLIWKSPTELEKPLAVDYYPDALWTDYYNYFSDKDIWAQALATLAPDQVHDLVPSHIGTRDFLNSEIYNDLARKYGDDTVHCMAAKVPAHNSGFAAIGLHRALRAGNFKAKEQQRLQRALPHIKRLVTLWQTLGGASRSLRMTENILDSLTAGVMVLDGSGYLVYQNRAAENMLKRNDGLGCRLGLLVAAEHDVTVKLQAIVKRILLNPTVESSGALRIGRPSGSRAYHLMLVPLRQQLPSLSGKVLAVLDDPESPVGLQRELLENLFGLTPAEAELAAQLAEGRSLEQIAGRKNVAMSTVRAQTKAVLAKTDTSRQAELVALVARLPRT
jgi:DNA-binding CsgD family transcriptional regulator/PAS domain-containing protein